jgi:hypothetical protein
VIGFVIFVTGCHPLPAGDLAAVNASQHAPRAGKVFLLRGWRDLYSAGIDDLAAKLERTGVSAHVYRVAQWPQLAEALAQKPARHPLVLIGFSYGADDVIEIARKLEAVHEPVDLLITIDPVTPPSVPDNVKVCYNYFQTNGIWDVFPWLRGIPLPADGKAKLINVDIRAQRPDLLEPNTAHSNIAANPKLHREILQRVLEICPPSGSTSACSRE